MLTATTHGPQPVSVLPAGDGDIDTIRELAHRIWPVCYEGVLTHAQVDNMLQLIYSAENLRDEMRQGHSFWLAVRGGIPAGFVSAYKEGDDIWIKKLYVDTTLHKQGIGQTLMSHAITALGPAAQVRLLVNPNNIAAQRFYEHTGFRQAGKKPVKMGDHHFTDLIYMRPLLG
jgi:diamine N-acetyltransferase